MFNHVKKVNNKKAHNDRSPVHEVLGARQVNAVNYNNMMGKTLSIMLKVISLALIFLHVIK